jgi:hypothetical protein
MVDEIVRVPARPGVDRPEGFFPIFCCITLHFYRVVLSGLGWTADCALFEAVADATAL